LLLHVGEAIVIGIQVDGVSSPVPVGILGLAGVERKGVKKVDDAIAIGIAAVHARALDHLQGGDAVEDKEAVVYRSDSEGLTPGWEESCQPGRIGMTDIHDLEP